MRSLLVPAAMVVAAASYLTARPATSLAAADIVVRSNEKRSHDCQGGSVTVEGGFNVLTLRNCAELTVNGGDNTIDAGVVGTIVVSGADNHITWTESPDGKRPRVTNEGEDNTIVSKKASGAARSSQPASGAQPAAPPQSSRVTVSGDEVKVQGPDGTVAVGANGTISVKEGASTTVAASQPGAGRIRVDQDDHTESYDCSGKDAIVEGDRNKLSFRNCGQLSISGAANVVAVQGVRSVKLDGDGNKLTWEPAQDGSRPSITDNGTGNVVARKR